HHHKADLVDEVAAGLRRDVVTALERRGRNPDQQEGGDENRAAQPDRGLGQTGAGHRCVAGEAAGAHLASLTTKPRILAAFRPSTALTRARSVGEIGFSRRTSTMSSTTSAKC